MGEWLNNWVGEFMVFQSLQINNKNYYMIKRAPKLTNQTVQDQGPSLCHKGSTGVGELNFNRKELNPSLTGYNELFFHPGTYSFR
jgi:hypothetical protein